MITRYSEKEIIRLLLKFGNMEFEKTLNKEDGKEEVLTIVDYIVREITSDELVFDDSVCAKIFNEFRFHEEHGLITGEKQFVKHEDPQISSLSADLLADSHELSKIWTEKHTFVETEEMKLKLIVGDTVLKFKSDKIKKIRKEIMDQLKEAVEANETERVLSLQKRYAALSVALGAISRKLGNRILL